MKQSTRKHPINDNRSLDDWVTALARQHTLSSMADHIPTTSTAATTKQERIEKRLTKRQHQQERKMMMIQLQQVKSSSRAIQHEQQRNRRKKDDRRDTYETKRNEYPMEDAENQTKKHRGSHPHPQLQQLSQSIQDIVERTTTAIDATKKKKWCRPYTPIPSAIVRKRKRQRCSTTTSTTSSSVDDRWQPRRSNYGGIGLARASLWIDLQDPSYRPKLEQEFAEHIPGFYGKQRTKAMKKQLDGNMLWRQLLQKRQQEAISSSIVGGKKSRRKKNINSNEQVESLIRSGALL